MAGLDLERQANRSSHPTLFPPLCPSTSPRKPTATGWRRSYPPPTPRCQSARDACLSPASKMHCTSQEWLKLRFSNKIFSLTVFRTPKCLSQLVSLYFRTLDLLSGRNRVLHPVETGHLLRSVRPRHAPACNSGTLALLKEVQTPWLT